MRSIRVVWSVVAVWAAIVAAAETSARAAEVDVDVLAREVVVRSAPFGVAPEVGRVHVGDKLRGNDQASGQWRLVQLPGGRRGYLPDADVRAAVAPAPSPQAAPVAPPVVAPTMVAAAPDSVAGAPSATGPAYASAQVGFLLELLPLGSFSTAEAGSGPRTDTAVTVAVAPFFDVSLASPYVSLGLSPQFVFGVKGIGGTSSATEYDLRARLTARYPVSPGGAMYARLSPAYSIISVPDLTPGVSNPAGFLVDFSVGGEIVVLPNLSLVVEVGYQIGFQTTTGLSGAEVDFETRFLHLGAGFLLPL